MLVLGVRLLLVFQVSGFSDDIAYFNLRQIGSIANNGFPTYQDGLSYGGRFLVFMPVFHYVCAFFDIFMSNELVGKLIPNIFATLLVFVVFYLTKELTKDNNASLLSAFVSGFIPIFFTETLNKVSVYSLAVPVIFLSIFFIMKINKDKKFILPFVITILFMSFIHASAFIVIMGLVFYVLILKIQKIKLTKYILELILFSTFFIIWLEFLLFKKAFLKHGFLLLWQNIPLEVVNRYFASIPLFDALVYIGFVPFLFGLYAAYKYSFKTRDVNVHLLMAFGLSVFFILWLKLIALEFGLIFLGVLLTIGFGRSFSLLTAYIKRTKFVFVIKYVTITVIVLVILTSIIPSYTGAKQSLEQVPSVAEVSALTWLIDNEKGIVLSTLNEGHLISGIAKKQNFMDSNFLFINDIDQKYDDLRIMYTSLYTTNVVQLFNKYGVKYIYFSDNARKKYGIENLAYLSDNCFEKVYDEQGVEIYKSLCKLEEES